MGQIRAMIGRLSGAARAVTDPAPRDWRERIFLREQMRHEITLIAQSAHAGRTAPVTIGEIQSLAQSELEQRFRQQAYFWPMSGNVGMARTIGGRLIFVDTLDFTLSPHLMTTGFWEIWITQAMARLLRPGMVVADVGANLGYYTVLMAEAVGPKGRVFAYEPNPAIAALLERTVSINGYTTATVDRRAVAGQSGQTVHFQVPAGTPMNASIVAAPDGVTGLIQTITVTLDDALPQRVDFLKIDVEGAEYQVWRGLDKTVDANRTIKIFLEVNFARQPQLMPELLQDIQQKGFILRYVGEDGEIKPCNEAYIMAQAPRDVVLMLERGSPSA